MYTLSIKNISKSYGDVKVLDNINLKITTGIFALLGPNGAGKTTLMKVITDILKADAGEVIFSDIENKKQTMVGAIGYLPQQFSIYENMKVYDVLYYIASLKEINKKEIDKEVKNVLKQTNLLDVMDKKIKFLSGGMLRRVGVAQALLGNPKILIIDEPTTGLDPKNRIIFRNLLNDLAKDRIIIISTHIVEDVEATCNNLCVLDKGKVVYEGSLVESKAQISDRVKYAILEREDFERIKDIINLISFKINENMVEVRFIKEVNDVIEFKYDSASPELEDVYFYLVGDEDSAQN
ncbi:MAG: ABC transporter ATP-binding protein [Sarcina sp.]